MLIRSLIYGFTGQCIEIVFTGIVSLIRGDKNLTGRTCLWMFPIYASAVFLEPIHDNIVFLPILLRGCIYAVIIWSIEFVSGWGIKKIIGSCPWDYSKDTKLSFFGFIRWDFFPEWFFAGLFFEKYHSMLKIFFP